MTRPADRRRRGLAPAEAELWHRAMAGVTPLRRAPPPRALVPIPTDPASVLAPTTSVDPVARSGQTGNLTPAEPASAPIRSGPGLDRRTLERMRRGALPIAARIDLHGLTQIEAHAVLDTFLARSVATGARLLLVITGKGSQGDGVLRRLVPRWIQAGAQARHVLRIEPAHARHGGGGALYVYLRRDRSRASDAAA
jgi:DNA-nicking Smr family endonuclease